MLDNEKDGGFSKFVNMAALSEITSQNAASNRTQSTVKEEKSKFAKVDSAIGKVDLGSAKEKNCSAFNLKKSKSVGKLRPQTGNKAKRQFMFESLKPQEEREYLK